MLAQRFAGILPPLTLQETIKTTKVHGLTGMLNGGGGLLH